MQYLKLLRIGYSCYCAKLARGVKGKKIPCVVEGNPSGKKRLLNTPADFFSLFGRQVVLFFKKKKKKKKPLSVRDTALFISS